MEGGPLKRNDPRLTAAEEQVKRARQEAATERFRIASTRVLWEFLMVSVMPRSDANREELSAALTEIQSRLAQIEGIKMGDSPWVYFRNKWPDKTTPIYIRERQKEIYATWLLGWIAEPALSARIELEPAEWQWLPIPE